MLMILIFYKVIVSMRMFYRLYIGAFATRTRYGVDVQMRVGNKQRINDYQR